MEQYAVNKAASAETEALLPPVCGGLTVRVYPTLDSSNTEARRLLAAGELTPPALLIADEQTGGRGRLGRSFYSPANTGLYLTLVLRVPGELGDAVRLTTLASVATAKAIERLAGVSPGIKWVNDLYLGERKICGILTEALPAPGGVDALIGIGVNLTTDDFPGELAGVAASVGRDVPRYPLAAAIAGELMELASDPDPLGYLGEYRARSMVLGRRILCLRAGEGVPATALAIDDAGGLVVRYDDGREETLTSGEISIRFESLQSGNKTVNSCGKGLQKGES